MRLNFEFPEARVQELKQLQTELGVDMKTLFNNALSVFEWCVEETKAGNEIAAVNEQKQTFRVLVTPVLQGRPKQVQAAAPIKGVIPAPAHDECAGGSQLISPALTQPHGQASTITAKASQSASRRKKPVLTPPAADPTSA